MRAPGLPADDLDYVLSRTRDIWQELRGARVFITGGTGFFGIWLLGSFLHAARLFNTGARALVLSRDPAAFITRWPEFSRAAELEFIRGDVRDFDFRGIRASHIIHAATDVEPTRAPGAAGSLYDSIVSGTERVLEMARISGADRLLYVSSGAVYDRNSRPEGGFLEEDPLWSLEEKSLTSYARGKVAAEKQCLMVGETGSLGVSMARGFAFAGPGLSLRSGFALTDFIKGALCDGRVEIKSRQKVLRSYMYPADLAVWLWTMLVKGRSGQAYNLGSDRPVELSELASGIAAQFEKNILIADQRSCTDLEQVDAYWPSTRLASETLGLGSILSLDETLRRSINWYKGFETGGA